MEKGEICICSKQFFFFLIQVVLMLQLVKCIEADLFCHSSLKLEVGDNYDWNNGYW